MALDTLKRFIADEQAWDMYVTGPAGTGKTTQLHDMVAWLEQSGTTYIVCAYTHQACNVLRSKLPANANVSTLHAYLKKCPSVNDAAINLNHVDGNIKVGEPEKHTVLLLDEFSMTGEKDAMDIVALQDQNDDGTPSLKLISIGDPYQLGPVKDFAGIRPSGPYWVQLEKVWRTERQDLLNLSQTLIKYIKGAAPAALPASPNFIRGKDLVKEFLHSKEPNKGVLAWTNKRVQELNFAIAGRSFPVPSDELWSATLRQHLVLQSVLPAKAVTKIETVSGPLELGSKWRTLEQLQSRSDVVFFEVFNTTLQEPQTIAAHFGTNHYKVRLAQLTADAVAANQAILTATGCEPAKWSAEHRASKLAKLRGKAWRDLLTFKASVCSVDFPFATTIHKSQGSTFTEVYLDTKDLARCAKFNLLTYLTLFYVGVSRASHKVVTN